VLVDSRQKRWIGITVILGVAALAVYGWLNQWPGGVTGGTTAGLWYGSIGSALMIFAALLSLLRRVPSWWWIGSRKFWLAGHVWLGLLSGVFILCHSGFRLGGLLEQVLWVVLALTLLTGVFGLALQQFIPRLITNRVTREAPYEQIPHLCEEMRRKADELVKKIMALDIPGSVADLMQSQMGVAAQIRFLEFYGKEVKPFLGDEYRRLSLLADPLQAESKFAYWRALPAFAAVKEPLVDLEDLCEERRQLAEQGRLHAWLHAWLLVHVPLSALLLVLGAAHAFMALKY
jgi:hypothetical protein